MDLTRWHGQYVSLSRGRSSWIIWYASVATRGSIVFRVLSVRKKRNSQRGCCEECTFCDRLTDRGLSSTRSTVEPCNPGFSADIPHNPFENLVENCLTRVSRDIAVDHGAPWSCGRPMRRRVPEVSRSHSFPMIVLKNSKVSTYNVS